MPTKRLFSNYNKISKELCHIVERSYEDPEEWYFLTFKPFNKNYDRDIDFYCTKGLDHSRKKIGKVSAYIMTREIYAQKVHINMLCVSARPLDLLFHNKKTNKYYIYAEKCNDRRQVFQYIIKESKTRNFIKYKDYVSS